MWAIGQNQSNFGISNELLAALPKGPGPVGKNSTHFGGSFPDVLFGLPVALLDKGPFRVQYVDDVRG